MSEILVRTATLDDTTAITAIHVSNIERWQRLDERGQVQDVPYDRLTLYERWLHGGPWMSVETSAVHMTHLRRGAGIPLVAEIDGEVVAHAEVYHGQEPPPFGEHLHVAVLIVHADHVVRGLEGALLAHIVALGQELACERVCIANPDAQGFYDGEGWRLLSTSQHVSWPARAGLGFYQATPHPPADPAQIAGWMMPLGRGQSARCEWVMRWPDLWAAVPCLYEQHIERLKFTVGGGTIYVIYAESPYDPRRASVYLWMSKPPTGPIITAVNDRAHKLGFRRLETVVFGDHAAILGPDVEEEGVRQELYSIELL